MAAMTHTSPQPALINSGRPCFWPAKALKRSNRLMRQNSFSGSELKAASQIATVAVADANIPLQREHLFILDCRQVDVTDSPTFDSSIQPSDRYFMSSTMQACEAVNICFHRQGAFRTPA
jgi:hypothetical protein